MPHRQSLSLDQARIAAKAGDWAELLPLLDKILGEIDAAAESANPGSLDPDLLAAGLDLALQCLEQTDFQTGWDLAKLLPRFGKAAIAPLLNLLATPETRWETQWFTCQILGGMHDPAIASALVQQLQELETPAHHDDWDEDELDSAGDLRSAILDALVKQGSAAILPLKSLLLESTSRKAAVAALAQIRTRDTLSPLLTVVGDPDPEIRVTALDALSSFRNQAIPAVLIKALSDQDPAVRRVAVIGLGLRPEAATSLQFLPLLTERLWDLDLGVCQQAAIALGRLGDLAAIPFLLQCLNQPQIPPELKLTAIRALGWLQQPEALDALKLLLLEPEIPSGLAEAKQVEIAILLGQQQLQPRYAAAIAIQALSFPQPCLSIPVRQALITSLGQLAEPSAEEALRECLADPDLTIQLHAIAALKQLGITTSI